MLTQVVHRWRMYDARNDEWIISRRWATIDAITRVNGELLPGQERTIEMKHLNGDGMTDRDFNPDAAPGFQTAVRTNF